MFCISVLFGNLPFRTLCLYLMVCPRHKDLNKHLIYTCVITDHTRVPSVYRAIGLPWGAVFSSGFQNIPLAWIAASFHWPTGGLSLSNKKSWFVWCWALKKSFGESVIYFKPYCMPLATLDLTGLFSLELIQSSHCSVSDQLCEWPGSLQLYLNKEKKYRVDYLGAFLDIRGVGESWYVHGRLPCKAAYQLLKWHEHFGPGRWV